MWIKCGNGNLVNLNLVESIYIKEEFIATKTLEDDVQMVDVFKYDIIAETQRGTLHVLDRYYSKDIAEAKLEYFCEQFLEDVDEYI